MGNLKYHLISNDDQTFITVFVPGSQPLAADNTHANFEQIVAGALAGDEKVVDLFDLAKTAAARFDALKFENLAGSERVTVSGGRVYLDGDEVDNSLTKQIVRFIKEGEDFAPLVRFFEKVQQNPNEHSRNQLFDWLNADDFTITDDGDIMGYKGVQPTDNGFQSISSGRAIVNGEVKEGRIPQNIGDVVEMPRSDVAHDPAVACHTGLHVGTYDYASGFAQGALLEVHVNPRDVVSVPSDCNAQKMRVCRYTVVDTLEGRINTSVRHTSTWADDDWGDGEGDETCWDCGEYLEDCVCEDYVGDETPDEPSVKQGQVYRDTDPRRNGRTLTVESVDEDNGVAFTRSSSGLRRTVSLDRLTSHNYEFK